MEKLIIRAAAILTAAFVIAAAGGVMYNSHVRTEHMPAEIRYEVAVDENIWPDHYYSEDYDYVQFRNGQLATYWTFEYGTHPLAGPVWVFHTFPIKFEDVSLHLKTLTR
jgi:hypothetical protein